MTDHSDTADEREAGGPPAADSDGPEREKLPFMPHEDDESPVGDTDQHSTA